MNSGAIKALLLLAAGLALASSGESTPPPPLEPGGGGGGFPGKPGPGPSADPPPAAGASEPPAHYFSGDRAVDWFGERTKDANPFDVADIVPVMRAAALALATVGTVYLYVLTNTAETQEVATTLGSTLDAAYNVLHETMGATMSVAQAVAQAFRDVANVVTSASRHVSIDTREWVQKESLPEADPTWSARPDSVMRVVSEGGSESGPWSERQSELVQMALQEALTAWAS